MYSSPLSYLKLIRHFVEIAYLWSSMQFPLRIVTIVQVFPYLLVPIPMHDVQPFLIVDHKPRADPGF